MKFGIPRETVDGENRVAVIPRTVKSYVEKGHEILLESGAGSKAGFADSEYEEAGATILASADKLFSDSDIIVKVNRLAHNSELGKDEVELLTPGKAVIGLLDPLNDMETIRSLVEKNVTVFSMEFLPRITRAQSMDVLSSMSTIAGYKAVLQAAEMVPKFFPLLMTAAGTIPPANTLVIGAGVAGLQAIAT
nr:NAD(P)(+) transhydrogenase (Re/Si-specific) subunit alpha [Gammaproteobacteria bacterium]NIT53872.1 NAD(P)(+) transhydrogenase (Re/Si-specific) subunit alpha [candidate division Zixibacteria bacterium]NIW44348.1 NAD(P)(+) transhydrogenase (Re/Si-specific) subunit alpha [Gammaproteobacteria bacterium]NIX55465.1 NAD(P)(+) transhydrogenase (Re/Si-specific) subunit alpha [candidate division Zixibacteria bacterium]